MTNEMKLIMALCDALGFEVEEVATEKSIKERKEYIRSGCAFDPKLEYEYKLTKKTDGQKWGDVLKGGGLKDKIDEAREIERYRALYGRKL